MLKPTLFIGSLVTIVHGTKSVKRGDLFNSKKKKRNITGMSRIVLKDLTSQIMLGRTIILLTLRMQLLLIKATIACVKLLNLGILPGQLTLKITQNRYLDNI